MPVNLSRPIPLYLPDSPLLARYAVEYEHFRARAYGKWADLCTILPYATPDSIVLVDPYGSASTPAPALFDVLKRFPSVSVVVALELTPARVGDLRRMVEAGISGVVNLTLDSDASTAVRQFYDAVGRPFKRTVHASVPLHVPPGCLRNPTSSLRSGSAGWRCAGSGRRVRGVAKDARRMVQEASASDYPVPSAVDAPAPSCIPAGGCGTNGGRCCACGWVLIRPGAPSCIGPVARQRSKQFTTRGGFRAGVRGVQR